MREQTEQKREESLTVGFKTCDPTQDRLIHEANCWIARSFAKPDFLIEPGLDPANLNPIWAI